MLGQRSGQGRCEYSAGGWYEGEYLMNRKHGHGVMLSGDGSRYEGQFKDGKKSEEKYLLFPLSFFFVPYIHTYMYVNRSYLVVNKGYYVRFLVNTFLFSGYLFTVLNRALIFSCA